MKSKLHLKKEALTQLVADDLRAVAAGFAATAELQCFVIADIGCSNGCSGGVGCCLSIAGDCDAAPAQNYYGLGAGRL